MVLNSYLEHVQRVQYNPCLRASLDDLRLHRKGKRKWAIVAGLKESSLLTVLWQVRQSATIFPFGSAKSKSFYWKNSRRNPTTFYFSLKALGRVSMTHSVSRSPAFGQSPQTGQPTSGQIRTGCSNLWRCRRSSLATWKQRVRNWWILPSVFVQFTSRHS